MMKEEKKDTKQIIAENFKELLCKSPIEKITVKEITEKSGVIRPTFYNHFSDKYEVLEYIIRTELLEPIRPLLYNNMIPAAYTLLLSNIKNDMDFYKRAVVIEGQNSFSNIVVNAVAELLLATIEKLHPVHHFRYSWMSREMLAEYYANTICYIAVNWIKRDFAISPDELAEIFEYINHHSFIDIFNDIV
ncbi:MAG: TetR/AcrR family transcriptional regulator C-terminal domain-containing protein [Lachnospiraceae bacterium]|nr:TetR/AcrR family transcriptional regulator C-terminal domain-containing protein [Lachnospiraceae bacterium]